MIRQSISSWWLYDAVYDADNFILNGPQTTVHSPIEDAIDIVPNGRHSYVINMIMHYIW